MNGTKLKFTFQAQIFQRITSIRWLKAVAVLFYCWLLIKINHPVLKTCFCFFVLGTKIIFTLTVNISQLLLSLNNFCLSKPCIIGTQTSSCNCKHTNPKLKVHYSHNRRQVEAFHNDTEFPF